MLLKEGKMSSLGRRCSMSRACHRTKLRPWDVGAQDGPYRGAFLYPCTKIVFIIKNESLLVHISATTTKFNALYSLQIWSRHEAEHF